MALACFTIIVSIDSNNGISKDGEIPWISRETAKFLKEMTMGIIGSTSSSPPPQTKGSKTKNVVIMGRKTYEDIPDENKPLEGRMCAVISKTWKQENHKDCRIYPSFSDVLSGLGTTLSGIKDIFVCGGEQVYEEAVQDYLYLCDKIIVTKFKTDYECDQFFPFDRIKNLEQYQNPTMSKDYTRYFYQASNIVHPEYQYIDLIKNVKANGEIKIVRETITKKYLFGSKDNTLTFDLSERFPILTTRKINYENVINEFLLYYNGNTDTGKLNSNLWKAITKAENLKDMGLEEYPEGFTGPLYGYQWRHWNKLYNPLNENKVHENAAHAVELEEQEDQGIDQIENLIEQLKNDPYSNTHILSCWNVEQISQAVLYPNHIVTQFNVSCVDNIKYLDCLVYCKSCDLITDFPNVLIMYATLTHIIGLLTELIPRKLTITIGESYVYEKHSETVSKILNRTPYPFATFNFRNSRELTKTKKFTFDSILIQHYSFWPQINCDIILDQ
jgi:thymidylate synthase